MGSLAVLVRLQRRARRRSWTARALGATLATAGAGLVYLVGAGLRERLIPERGIEWSQLAIVAVVVVMAFAAFVAAAVGTLGQLLREVRDEDDYLAALPLTFRTLATARLVTVSARAVGAACLSGLLVGIFLWGLAGTAWPDSVQPVLPLGPLLRLAARTLLLVLPGIALGSLVALAAASVVPPRHREAALISAVLLATAAATLAAVRADAWLGDLGETVSARRVFPLRPDEAAPWVRDLWSGSRALAVSGAALVVATAALGFSAARWLWAALLRADVTASARLDRSRPLPPAAQRRFAAIDRLTGWLPMASAAVLVRDVRIMVRTPAVRVRLVALSIAVLALVLTGIPSVWVLLLLYYAPSEIARDALLDSLDEEGENLFFLSVLVPDLRSYLRLRAVSGWLITLAALIPLLAVVVLVDARLTGGAAGLMARLALLTSAAWLDVIAASAATAVFSADLGASGRSFQVSPAQLPAAVCGAAAALLCALVDVLWIDPAVGAFVPVQAAWLPGVSLAVLVGALAASPAGLSFAARRLGRRAIDP